MNLVAVFTSAIKMAIIIIFQFFFTIRFPLARYIFFVSIFRPFIGFMLLFRSTHVSQSQWADTKTFPFFFYQNKQLHAFVISAPSAFFQLSLGGDFLTAVNTTFLSQSLIYLFIFFFDVHHKHIRLCENLFVREIAMIFLLLRVLLCGRWSIHFFIYVCHFFSPFAFECNWIELMYRHVYLFDVYCECVHAYWCFILPYHSNIPQALFIVLPIHDVWTEYREKGPISTWYLFYLLFRNFLYFFWSI